MSAVWNPIGLTIAVAICLLISHWLFNVGQAAVRRVEVWSCGARYRPAEMRYAASSYYGPVRDLLRVRLGRHQIDLYPRLPRPKINGLRRLRRALEVDQWLYYPSLRWGGRLLQQFARTRVGVPQAYVLWTILGMILSIVVLSRFS